MIDLHVIGLGVRNNGDEQLLHKRKIILMII